MNTVVIEHVKLTKLPEAWRSRLGAAANASVTVRIEEEAADHEPSKDEIDDPLFGTWRKRENMADVEAYTRKEHALSTGRLEAGAELVDIQALLGRVNLGTTQISTHVSEDRIAGVVARL